MSIRTIVPETKNTEENTLLYSYQRDGLLKMWLLHREQISLGRNIKYNMEECNKIHRQLIGSAGDPIDKNVSPVKRNTKERKVNLKKEAH